MNMKHSIITLYILGIITVPHVVFSQGSPGTGDAALAAYKNFDFIPGEKILFFDDFSRGLSQWNVVEWDLSEESQQGRVTSTAVIPGNWYFMPRKGTSQPKGIKTLPDQFTLEYDFFVDENVSEHEGGILNIIVKEADLNIHDYSFHFDTSPQILMELKAGNDLLFLGAWREYGYTEGIEGSARILQEIKENYWVPNKVHRISISRNGSHVTLYVNQDKVIDLPNALPPNENYTLLLCNNLWISGYYISNVRLATGIPQPAMEFKDERPFVTQNILFDVNSDRIKPSSYQIMRKIAQAIKDIDGKVLIVGHTDSDGDADSNMELSKRRSASVKNMLVSEFGVPADMLETDGKGQVEPVESNDTPQGKANNRRVEFIIVR